MFGFGNVKVRNGKKIEDVINLLTDLGFKDDESLRSSINSRSAYHKNGVTFDLEYTDRPANLRFIASTDHKGKLRKVVVMSHPRPADVETQTLINTTNMTLVTAL